MSWFENQARAKYEQDNQRVFPVPRPVLPKVETAHGQIQRHAHMSKLSDISLAQRRRALGY